MSTICYLDNQRLTIQLGKQLPARTSLLRGAPELNSDAEPDATEIIQAITEAYDNGYEKSAATEFELAGIAFAGYGDPLLYTELLEQVLRVIKQQRHGVPITLVTYGLVSVADAAETCAHLVDIGVEALEVYMPAATPNDYQRAVEPLSAGFGDVCNFISVASEAGLIVSTFAYSDVKGASDIRALSLSLGAREFVIKAD